MPLLFCLYNHALWNTYIIIVQLILSCVWLTIVINWTQNCSKDSTFGKNFIKCWVIVWSKQVLHNQKLLWKFGNNFSKLFIVFDKTCFVLKKNIHFLKNSLLQMLNAEWKCRKSFSKKLLFNYKQENICENNHQIFEYEYNFGLDIKGFDIFNKRDKNKHLENIDWNTHFTQNSLFH